jgi:hypothetical protein
MTRRGFATTARAAGHDPLEIARAGGWVDGSRVLARYMDDVDHVKNSPRRHRPVAAAPEARSIQEPAPVTSPAALPVRLLTAGVRTVLSGTAAPSHQWVPDALGDVATAALATLGGEHLLQPLFPEQGTQPLINQQGLPVGIEILPHREGPRWMA